MTPVGVARPVYLAKSETDMDGYVAAGALTEVMDDGEEN
jgi:hypothetical protein